MVALIWKDNVAIQQQERKNALDSEHRAADMLSELSSSETRPSISCTCTECTAFLRPSFASRSHQPQNISHFALPAIKTFHRTQVPVWIDKLSLAAYEAQTITSVSVPRVTNATNSQQQLSVITSAKHSTVNIHSAFPRTPGALRCAHSHCGTRIPIASQMATTTGLRLRSLCDEHAEQFSKAEGINGQSAVVSETMDLYQRYDAESCWGSNDADGSRRAELGMRLGHLASWKSLGSWRSDDAEFGWDAKAFDSKLCW